MNYRNLSPTIRINLVRYQHEADRQARTWVLDEIRASIRVRPDTERNSAGHLSLCAIYAGPAMRSACNCGARAVA